MVIGFVLIMLFKGSGVDKSFVGIEKCDAMYWSLYGFLVLFGLCMSVVSVLIQKHEYELKKRIGWRFTPCDYKHSLKSALGFPLCAFIFSFTSILVGFTPAFFFVPLLLANHLQLESVIMTNAILSVFSTFCATLLNVIFRRIPFDYQLADALFAAVGTVAGILIQQLVRKKTGKMQYSMMGFNFVILTLLGAISTYQTMALKSKAESGLSIYKSANYCY